MSEPNFNFLSLPDFLLADIEKRIIILRSDLRHGDPSVLIDQLRRLTKVRGNFAFDLISSIAWAAEVVCTTAAGSARSLNHVEVQSLSHAFDAMDRARRTAILSAAA
ncbi:MAG TPA: hypothetical protein VJ853_06720 [Thermoanaerobaculia bacterium]|nr:hypothetical protein [Thermoanaerobaculia bacterium]